MLKQVYFRGLCWNFPFHVYFNNLPGIRPCIRYRPIRLMRSFMSCVNVTWTTHSLTQHTHTHTHTHTNKQTNKEQSKDREARVTAVVLSRYSCIITERRGGGFPEVPGVVMISWVGCPISISPFRQINAFKPQSFLYVTIPFHDKQ